MNKSAFTSPTAIFMKCEVEFHQQFGIVEGVLYTKAISHHDAHVGTKISNIRTKKQN